RSWLGAGLARLRARVGVLAGVWVPLAIGVRSGGVPWATESPLLRLVLDPLWFLGVYAGLMALTPLAMAMVRRLGACAACVPAAVVAAGDLVRFGLGGAGWGGLGQLAAGRLGPVTPCLAWARRGVRVPAGPTALSP